MSDVAEMAPVARILGEPLLELPQDLYIPPQALEIFLETFEGPLDLLLYLIRKHGLDPLDIPMAEVTRQYMEYVELMRVNRLELAAEYLLMAALLVEIKSRMLLPRQAESAEEEADPRAELVRRLLEYEQMKLAAYGLDQVPQAGRDYTLAKVWVEEATRERLPEVNPADLAQAWLGLLAKARVTRHHKITREQLSVREHMTRILRYLREREFVEFSELFDVEQGVPELVVSFLAVLELVKEALVEVSQQEAFAPIYVKLNHALVRQ